MVNVEKETDKLGKHRKSDMGFVNAKVCFIDSLLVHNSQIPMYIITIYLDSWRTTKPWLKMVSLRKEVTEDTAERYKSRNQGYRS